MKLLKKMNAMFLITSLSVMFLMGTVLTLVLSYVTEDQIQDQLKHSYKRILNQIEAGRDVHSLLPFFEIDTIAVQPETIFYTKSVVKEALDKKPERFKQLTGITTINGVTYRVIVRISELETEDYNESIITVVLIAILIMIAVLFFVNRRISASVWKDFYHNLSVMKRFSLQNLEPVALKTTNITEFDELNHVLDALTRKVITDYQNLKQFSEDASHELQTPLAIIRSKLESLIDGNSLNMVQIEKLQGIYQTVNRLTRLNKDLLLLTKVENNQFVANESISINAIIRDRISDWYEIVELKNFELHWIESDEIWARINPFLAETAVSNLFSNAINHTPQGGKINIVSVGSTITFSNTGSEPIANSESIFNRFHKASASSQSVGLGLAIVNKIAEANHITVTYRFNENMHHFTLNFSV